MSFPRAKTVIVHGYLTGFRVEVETLYGEPGLTNPFGLSPGELAKRQVEVLDILDMSRGHALFDASAARPSGSPPLAAGWQGRAAAQGTPLLCVYRLSRISCPLFGLQTAIESNVMSQQREVFGLFGAVAYVTQHAWRGLDMEAIARKEKEVALAVAQRLAGALGKRSVQPLKEAGYGRVREERASSSPSSTGRPDTPSSTHAQDTASLKEESDWRREKGSAPIAASPQ